MDKELFDYILNQVKTHPAFPKIYEGFREIEELEKAEDSLLNLIKDVVTRVEYDKVVETYSLDKIAEFEQNLSLIQAGTKDERKERLVEFLQRSGVINDDVLYSIAVEAAGTDDIDMISRPESYSLAITTKANVADTDIDQDGIPENLQKARNAVLQVAPQNLSVSVGVHAHNLLNQIATYGMRATLCSYNGFAKPYEETFSYIGLMDTDSSKALRYESIGFIDRHGSAPVSTKEMIGIEGFDHIGFMNISEEVELVLYSRSGPYQTLNQNLAAGANAHVYDEGAPATRDGDATKAYTIKEIFNAAGTSLDATNLALFVTSGKLKIQNNGSAAVAWNRLTCTEGPLPPLEIVACLGVTSTGFHAPLSKAFANNDDYYYVYLSGLTARSVVDKVNEYCGTLERTDYGTSDPFWNILWSENCNYELIGFYSDDYAETPITSLNVSDYYFLNSPHFSGRLEIKTTNAKPNFYITTIRIKITPK